ncbi:MAG TPA: efflux RND transporter periplasmic adaptor subunit [Thermoanaerobaculia bacterium]|nr:efflux RND transporter periplasmic adaptor subunit [Thermoanaerobaculia bacterium]
MTSRTIALAAALLLAAACTADKKAADKPAADQPAAAEPTPALPADVAQLATPEPSAGPAGTPKIEEAGTTALSSLEPTGEFVSPSSSEVAPKMPGRVAAVYVDEGSRVGRGQTLLTMETDYIRLDIRRAEADLARVKAAEADARREFDRKQGLLANESIPQATFDRAQAALDQAQAARTSAEVVVATARQRLADSVIRSPMTGVVSERRTNVGEHLGDAGVAFVIVQTAPLRLRFSVPERFLGEMKRGQPVAARVEPYPGEVFRGTIKTVGGVIDPATRTFFAEAEFPNSDGRLRPGLFARVNLGSGSEPEVSHAETR